MSLAYCSAQNSSRDPQPLLTHAEIHRSVATAQFSGGVDVCTRLKLLFPIHFGGEVRDFYTLNTPSFGVPVQRTQQHNVVVSGGLVVHY